MNAKVVAEWLERVAQRSGNGAAELAKVTIRSLSRPPIMSSRRRRN